MTSKITIATLGTALTICTILGGIFVKATVAIAGDRACLKRTEAIASSNTAAIRAVKSALVAATHEINRDLIAHHGDQHDGTQTALKAQAAQLHAVREKQVAIAEQIAAAKQQAQDNNALLRQILDKTHGHK